MNRKDIQLFHSKQEFALDSSRNEDLRSAETVLETHLKSTHQFLSQHPTTTNLAQFPAVAVYVKVHLFHSCKSGTAFIYKKSK